MTRHGRPGRAKWLLLLAVAALVAAHGAVLEYIWAHAALSTTVASALIGLAVLKHLGLLLPAFAALRRLVRRDPK
jgi:hypothetical protein